MNRTTTSLLLLFLIIFQFPSSLAMSNKLILRNKDRNQENNELVRRKIENINRILEKVSESEDLSFSKTIQNVECDENEKSFYFDLGLLFTTFNLNDMKNNKCISTLSLYLNEVVKNYNNYVQQSESKLSSCVKDFLNSSVKTTFCILVGSIHPVLNEISKEMFEMGYILYKVHLRAYFILLESLFKSLNLNKVVTLYLNCYGKEGLIKLIDSIEMKDKSLKNKIRNAVESLDKHVIVNEEKEIEVQFTKEDFIKMLMNDSSSVVEHIKDVIKSPVNKKPDIIYIIYKICGNLFDISRGIKNQCYLEYKYGELMSNIIQLSYNFFKYKFSKLYLGD